MLLTSWAIGLFVTSLLVLFVTLRAAFTAVRVVKFWDQSADTVLQIRLESEIWLSSSLMQYGLFLQIFSLFLLVITADSFAPMLPGAMCATGSFLANPYGMMALGLKLISVFFYGFWIVLHRLDIKSPLYPLVRLKYMYLLFLCPLLLADISFQTLFLEGIHPDIITSCCGVVFQEPTAGVTGLSQEMASFTTVLIFYGGCLLLFLAAWRDFPFSHFLTVIFSSVLFPAGLWIVTTYISPYVYAMPHHRCPFCLLHAEYLFVGYPLFISLYLASFGGMASALPILCGSHGHLQPASATFQKRFRLLLLSSLVGFTGLSLFYPAKYLIFGGE